MVTFGWHDLLLRGLVLRRRARELQGALVPRLHGLHGPLLDLLRHDLHGALLRLDLHGALGGATAVLSGGRSRCPKFTGGGTFHRLGSQGEIIKRVTRKN